MNIDFVRNLVIEQMENENGKPFVCVVAEFAYIDAEILKEFNSGDAAKDLKAAKEYLAELVETLNGGAK